MDGAHFVLGAYLGWLCCFARVVVRAPSGRQRCNVLGALHAITHQLITVTNDSSMNATSVCELLEKVAALGLQTPMTLVMENARYQRCRLVLERATQLGIELLFLPPYSFTQVGFWLKQPGKGDEEERSGEYSCQMA